MSPRKIRYHLAARFQQDTGAVAPKMIMEAILRQVLRALQASVRSPKNRSYF